MSVNPLLFIIGSNNSLLYTLKLGFFKGPNTPDFGGVGFVSDSRTEFCDSGSSLVWKHSAHYLPGLLKTLLIGEHLV